MLKEKTALISGASRGIGRSIAVKFAENGAFVGINYVSNDEEAAATLRTVREKGSGGMLLKGDVSNFKTVKKIVRKLVDEKHWIDILVCNAGVYTRNEFKKISNKNWDKTLRVNLSGGFYLCRETIPHMKPGGKIIFISSQLAFRGSSHGADYAASKAGQLGLMRSLALELGDKKINVNAIAPGTIETSLISDYTDEMREQRKKQIPLGRLGTPEDVANGCLFLASDLSNYITGETININGGLYIH